MCILILKSFFVLPGVRAAVPAFGRQVSLMCVCGCLPLQKLVAQMKQDPQVSDPTHASHLADRVWRGLHHFLSNYRFHINCRSDFFLF